MLVVSQVLTLYRIRICSKVHFDVLSIYLRKDASANYFLNVYWMMLLVCLFGPSQDVVTLPKCQEKHVKLMVSL